MTRSTRETETRANEMREEYNMDYVSPLSVPLSIRKDDYVYKWACVGIRGQNSYRVEANMAKGWMPVPADRAPNICLDPLERNPLAKRFICVKDVILMERPKIFSQKETRQFNERNANKVKSLRGVSNDIGSFARPLNSINSF